MSSKVLFEQEISSYTKKTEAATIFINIISRLWYEQAIELVLFRNQLIDRQNSHILNLHHEAAVFAENNISIFDSLAVADTLQDLRLPPSRIDVGTLAMEMKNESIAPTDLHDFLIRKLCKAHQTKEITPRDVVLYGFGRIGRLLARELIAKAGSGKQLRLRAIVTRDQVNETTLRKRAALLQHDSIHGDFEGTVEIDITNKALIINGLTVYILSAQAPEEIDYTAYQISNALVIDNTGAFRNADELSRHLKSKGAANVLLTAPGKAVPNIVYGINQDEIDVSKTAIYSAASCTTNAIAPVLHIIENKLGIIKGHIETIHAYTNDQNLVDNMHKKFRRGRAAALNMVITETGAGSAVAKAIPSLAGKLTSNAIRVPVPNGSLAILHLETRQATDVETLNKLIKTAALKGDLVEQIKYAVNEELVSSDIVGTSSCSIVDAPATIVSADGHSIVLYVWYDNEYGYAQQVMRLSRHIAGVRRFVYY
ncbi:glyceraldehyde-3-phosphate dehydrogenase [Sphingobacterium spiritivorum]|uniref:glyceraldehyde-3-phosphate dehydrogenase n=1 Tax=Sphingobacterium spiritivorum TaxID=258 RepID=UPI003DA4B0D2